MGSRDLNKNTLIKYVDTIWSLCSQGDIEGILEFECVEDMKVRQQLVSALGVMDKTEKLIGHVLRFKDDPAWLVRDEVVIALHRHKETEHLKTMCSDVDARVRRKVARALGLLKSFDGVVQMVHDQDMRTRIEVVRSLILINGFGPLLWLFRMSHDEDKMVFEEVVLSLEEMGQTDYLVQLCETVSAPKQAVIAQYLSRALSR